MAPPSSSRAVYRPRRFFMLCIKNHLSLYVIDRTHRWFFPQIWLLTCGGAGFILTYCPRLTRTHTVLTGRKAPMLLQSPCQYTKYCLRAFHCLNAFPFRQNCFAPDSDVFSSDFWFLRRRCVVTHQGEKDKKHRKDTLSGVCALVNRGYLTSFIFMLFSRSAWLDDIKNF